MSFLYEVFPVFLFFVSFKWYGIYIATLVGIIATFVQMTGQRLYTGYFDKKQVITFFVFLFFGGMTLYFHNPIFIKWKPTIVFWVFGFMLLITQVIGKKPMMQRMMEASLEGATLSPAIWRRLNMAWMIFFVLLGAINLWVAYQLSNDAWVNFKFYGITSALLVGSIAQALYLLQFLPKHKEGS